MRVVIDLQGAQAENSRRGIGRYTLSLSKAIVRNREEHEVIIALNGLFPETIESIRAEFDGLLPQNSIHVWYAPGPVNGLDTENYHNRQIAELVRECFLHSLKPDVIFVPSLFEGLVDDAVTSVHSFGNNIPVAVTLHDLIPLIYPKHYLKKPVVKSWYERKVENLRRADMIIAISESSRQEAINYIDFASKYVVNASEGADSTFIKKYTPPEVEDDIRTRYALTSPFVMYGGGIDYRKNIEGLLRAYAKLPKTLRKNHQLVVVCAIPPNEKIRLKALAQKHKIKEYELVFTGFVPEEDLLVLYNLCEVFVFPSLHEGFGLPILEAMSCGKAVIGSNTSSIPEVIGREDALFDPKDSEEMAEKMVQVLTDKAFRCELEDHGLKQAKSFSWDKTAKKSITALEVLYNESKSRASITSPSSKPKLAYVSPLPPERSGISNYSAELLPELAQYYDIDVIVAQKEVSDPWVVENCQVRSVKWALTHKDEYDRVLYHIGNSPFHEHMLDMLEVMSGAIVMHDFFLSGLVTSKGFHGSEQYFWEKELYESHGYKAIQGRFQSTDVAEEAYPCNLGIVRCAKGVILHSEYSQQLFRDWYVESDPKYFARIPHLRTLVVDQDRKKARNDLGLNAADFVVCSFGLLGPSKLNHRLLESWLASSLAKDRDCVLVFVGENHRGKYGENLTKIIRNSGIDNRIRITGWADEKTFHNYLTAADVGVQLRSLSRGETSGTVLDCMNYGLATIINANGSMADLPNDVVWKLPDTFDNHLLTKALDALRTDTTNRIHIGEQARDMVLSNHAPGVCAEQYFKAIEHFYQNESANVQALISAIAKIDAAPAEPAFILSLAQAIGQSIPRRFTAKQILVDVSELAQHDNKSGIQRVVRSILNEWLVNPPKNIRIEPVYATANSGYRYARSFTLGFLGCPVDLLDDEPIEYQAGDIFIGLDLQHFVIPAHKDFYQKLRRHGVQVQFVVYDLLCITMPQYFQEGGANLHRGWLDVVVADSDGAICISRAVADELKKWIQQNGTDRLRPLKVEWFHLGSDILSIEPSRGVSEDAQAKLHIVDERPTFLMVGTLEPRKGYAQVLAAFEQLWEEGVDVNLFIVGKQGWMVDELAITLRKHEELGKRLVWFERADDELLSTIYEVSTCLIAASEGEGFGLPLIEAAHYNLPIIARDMPVFREVAGEHAFYFDQNASPSTLGASIQRWLALYSANRHKRSNSMPWLTWKQSANNLLSILVQRENI